jgi:predicted amidohydrolase YtcJ
MVVDRSLLAEMARLGVGPVIQPDIHRLGDGYIAALGLERASQVIPMRLFREAGMTVAFSSDAPVIPCDPLEVIRSAMERRTPDGVALGIEHHVPPMEAIRNYTAGGAWATHTEKTKGRLAPGMFADFAVLSGDPAATSPDDFKKIRVVRTIRGGVETYAAAS